MKRFANGLAIWLSLSSAIFADEPSAQREVSGPAVPAEAGPRVARSAASQSGSASGLSARKRLEAQLREPAGLDFGERTSVTLAEFLAEIRSRHQISARLDAPMFAMLFGSGAIGSAIPQDGPAVQAAKTAFIPRSSLVLVAQEQSSAPSVPLPIDGLQAPTPVPVSPPATPSESTADGREESGGERASEKILELPISIAAVNLKTITLATAIRHALDAVSVVGFGDEPSGIPILLTEATVLDVLVEEDGLLITSRLQVLTRKETRVYSLKRLQGCPPDQLSNVIRQTVRPWSWRSQIDDLGDQLKSGGLRIPPSLLSTIGKVGLSAVSAATGGDFVVTVSDEENKPATEEVDSSAKDSSGDWEMDAEEMELVGKALVNLLTATLHASLNVAEMLHYADPPTGTLHLLPGKLIISQSQAAHREIAELLEQLADEAE